MEQELDHRQNQIKNTAGEEQNKLFVDYCSWLIQLKEENKITEEQVAYKITSIGLECPSLNNSSWCNEIFDIAAGLEIPRTTSYAQPVGKWDAKTADAMKQKGWRNLVGAVEKARASL